MFTRSVIALNPGLRVIGRFAKLFVTTNIACKSTRCEGTKVASIQLLVTIKQVLTSLEYLEVSIYAWVRSLTDKLTSIYAILIVLPAIQETLASINRSRKPYERLLSGSRFENLG